MPTNDSNLKIALAEILNGYSTISSPSFGKIFVKHFSNLDNSEIEEKYSEIYTLAVENELPTLEIREKEILDGPYWTEEKNRRIKDLESFIPNLRLTKTKLIRDLDKAAIQKQIEDAENETLKLKLIKNTLIGVTAETFTNRKVNEFFIYQALFTGPDLKTKKFTQEDYDELDESVIHELVQVYNKSLEKFGDQTIKKVSLSPNFSNSFYLCNDDPLVFYGRPVIQLTFYQIDLFANAKYFKGMIQNAGQKVPQEVLNDPDKLVDWFNTTQNSQKLINEAENSLAKTGKESGGVGGIAIVGLSSADAKKAGISNAPDPLDAALKAKRARGEEGGLTMEEIIKARGGFKFD